MEKILVRGYELRERIGAGGFGAVYRAFQPGVQREVAVKVILPQHANQPDFIRRFEVEAQLVARLEHPHIVPLYDYWRDPEGAYLVMRWLKGSLRHSLERGAWSIPNAARLLDQIAAALAVAHREGVIHRDIKPDNVLLDEDDNAYLADFGIAKDLNIREMNEDGENFIGSPAYVSPEQIKSDEISQRSDIYCLGLIVYEVLTGEKPFAAATTLSELIQKQLHAALPLMSERHPNIPAALDEILQTATAKDPNHRYPNTSRFAAAFRAAIPNLQRSAPQPLPDPLTEREMDILRLLVEGLSNQAMMERLFLTESTIRWYLKQIYSKLDVHSRKQAIDRAKQLNLLAGNAAFVPQNFPSAQIILLDGATEILTTPENPYKGLRAFQEADAQDFFGRAALTEQLLGRLTEDHSRLLVVVGPSGSGKSSVVKAGLIPALRRGALSAPGHAPFIAEMLPGTHPLEELEAALLRVSMNPMPGLLSQLQEDRRGLVRAVKRVLPNDQETELILVIDQFEELFTHVEDEQVRVHFIDNLLSAVSDTRSRIRVILTLRADFYDRPLMYPRLAELVRSHTEVVLPLTPRELEQAIVAPAERVRLSLESGLVTRMIEDVKQQPGMLPLLQYALTELFEQREGRTLTLAAYENSGGVIGALARRADDIFNSLDDEGQSAARQLFLRLITLGEGTEDTRRRTLLAEVNSLHPASIEEVISAFSQYRLLTFDRDPVTRTPTIEIAHEALIREWAKLREWVQSSREEVRMQRRLSAATAEWLHSERDPSFLASGARLDQFDIWAEETDLALAPTERTYLAASRTEQARLELLEAERKDRELTLARQAAEVAQQAATAQRQSANRMRYLAAALLIGVIGAVALSALAFSQRTKAETERNNAQAAQVQAENSAKYARSIALASAAQSAMSINQPDKAIALASAANTSTDQPPAFVQNILYQAAFTPATAKSLSIPGGHEADIILRPSPDGTHTLIGAGGIISLWDSTMTTLIASFDPAPELQNKWIVALMWHDDLAFASYFNLDDSSGKLIKFDPYQGKEMVIYEGEGVSTLFVSTDQQFVVGGTLAGDIHVWDIETGQQVRSFAEAHWFTQDIVLNPQEQTVWSSAADGTASLWDYATGEVLKTLSVDATANPWIGRIIPSKMGILGMWFADVNGYLTLWDNAGNVIRELKFDNMLIGDIALTRDQQTLAIGMTDGKIYLYETATWQPFQELDGHTRRILKLWFNQDDTQLISYGTDSTLRTWNIYNQAIEQTLAAHTAPISSFDLSSDGQTAISSSFDGRVILWDIVQEHAEEIATLDSAFMRTALNPEMRNWIRATLSPDGQQALIWLIPPQDNGCDPEAKSVMALYDTTTGEMLRQFDTGAGDLIWVAAFHPDGRVFTSFSDYCPSSIKVWDSRTGAQIDEWEAHSIPDQGVYKLQVSPDGRFLVSASADHTAILWDTNTGEKLHVLQHDDVVSTAAFSPDSQILLTGDASAILHVWNITTGAEIRRYTAHGIQVRNIAVSPDGASLLSSDSENNIILMDIATGEILRQISAPGASILGSITVFSPDGRSIYISGQNHTIQKLALYLDHDHLLAWVRENRYVRDLTCDERALYQVAPLCEGGTAW